MIGKKFDNTAATKTHGQVDAGFLDLLNPTAELDSAASTARSLIHFGLGWVGRGYKDQQTIGF